MTPEEHIKHLYNTHAAFKDWFDNTLPDLVGVHAVNFYTESFQNEGFTDAALEKWPEVKRRQKVKRIDRDAARRPILTGETKDLGSSLMYEKRALDEVAIIADTTVKGDSDYASAHNEGTTTAGRGNKTTIPKRQFIGKSDKLNELVVKISYEEAKKWMK